MSFNSVTGACQKDTSKQEKNNPLKNLTKDVSGADNSPFAVNNLTTSTGILPGQALPPLPKIPREAQEILC